MSFKVIPEELSNRLKLVIENKKIKSANAMAVAIGADPSYFSKAVKGKGILSEDYAKKIQDKYDVNYKWLLFGHGKMDELLDESLDKKDKKNTLSAEGGDLANKYRDQLEENNRLLKEREQLFITVTDLEETKKALELRILVVQELALKALGGTRKSQNEALDTIEKEVLSKFGNKDNGAYAYKPSKRKASAV